MFCARRPSSSAQLTKCRACHGICTLSPLDADLTIRFAKTRHTARLKCCVYATQNGDGRSPKCCACHQKCSSSSGNDAKVFTPATRNDPFCRTHHRHGRANGCEQLPTVAQRRANTPSTPTDPQSEMGTLATHSGMNPCLFFQ